MWCPECHEPTRWVRRVPLVHLALSFLTLGLWAVVVQFWRPRCQRCGLSWREARRKMYALSGLLSR